MAATLGLVGWFFSFRRRVSDKELKHAEAISITDREIANIQAWKKIETISSRVTNDAPDLGDVQFYIETIAEITQTVAEHYHPEQKEAISEIRIPYFLAVIEMVAKDLRIGFAENIPASHIITLKDIVRGNHRLATQGTEVYRLLRLLINRTSPIAAMMEEMATAASSQLYSETYENIKHGLIEKGHLLCNRAV